MGTRITDGSGNRLWKDYTTGGATGKGTYAVGDEILRLDAAMCSSRVVLVPLNDFATAGASATAQWSLDGVNWFPLPYSVQGGAKVATGIFALGTRQALILPDLGNFVRVIANTAGAFADPTANNLVAGLTEDDGLQFSPDTSGGGGGGGAATIANGADVAEGSTTDAATASGANTTVIGALRAIRDKLLGSLAVTGTFFQATQPVSSTDGALATIGTTTDAATASGANTTSIGALRAIRDKLLATLNVSIASSASAAAPFYYIDGLGYAPGSQGFAGMDDRGSLYTAERGSSRPVAGITPVATAAAASNLVAKASAGNLYGINAVSGASAGYIMAFDATSAPADGAVTPKWVLPLAANTGYSGNPAGSGPPMAFANGIVLVFSTTGPFTKTASATAFLEATVR